MHSWLSKYIILLVVSMAAFMVSTTAFAAGYQVLQCNSSGQVVSGTELLYDDPNAPADKTSFCSEVNPRDSSDKTIRVFSRVLCSFVVVLNQVLGKVYCGLQYNLQKYIAIAITIYIALFGLQILMGTAQMGTKEVLTRFIKVGLVWAFVSNYNYGVNLFFVFFIDFANQSIWWTLGSIQNSGGANITDIMGLPDRATTVSGVVPAYVYLDQLIYDTASGKFIDQNQELIGFFSILGFLFPPVFMIAAYWLWTTFMIFVRTLIAFLMCITAIAFLITLSPIFFCLMLFKATYQFFETWLKFMISFSLQVLIVFAVVAMWIMAMLNFVGFFDQLSKVIFLDPGLTRVHGVTSKSDSFGICPYIVSQGNGTGGQLRGPNVKCAKAGFDPFKRDCSGLPVGAECPLAESARKDLGDLIPLSNIAPPQQAGSCANDPNCEYGDERPSGAPQHRLNRLIYYTIYHLIVLVIVAYAFDALLKQAPSIAQQLAGPQYVPILGQGFGGLGYHKIPGLPKANDSPGGGGGLASSAVDSIIGKSREMPTARRNPG